MLQAEATQPWWEFYKPVVVHHVAGTPLFAFSAVFAPGGFSANVIHEWDHYDPIQKKFLPIESISV